MQLGRNPPPAWNPQDPAGIMARAVDIPRGESRTGHPTVTDPAGLDSRADIHLPPTLPCSTVQKLGVRRPAHHSLPWDVQGTPPERPHHRSSRRREGEARPVMPDLRKHSGGLGPDPRPVPDVGRAHL